jgi:hypothetical protein
MPATEDAPQGEELRAAQRTASQARAKQGAEGFHGYLSRHLQPGEPSLVAGCKQRKRRRSRPAQTAVCHWAAGDLPFGSLRRRVSATYNPRTRRLKRGAFRVRLPATPAQPPD